MNQLISIRYPNICPDDSVTWWDLKDGYTFEEFNKEVGYSQSNLYNGETIYHMELWMRIYQNGKQHCEVKANVCTFYYGEVPEIKVGAAISTPNKSDDYFVVTEVWPDEFVCNGFKQNAFTTIGIRIKKTELTKGWKEYKGARYDLQS